MPTGVHIRDARQQLFDAAERVMLRGGPHALTSRAVTDEAGVAKGVLHRHFVDFDAFLAELVLEHAARLDARAVVLRESAGTGTVADNLVELLTELFSPVVVAIVPLITFRDGLRERLRRARPGGGIAVLSDATNLIRAYLARERDYGRIAADADVEALALALVGGGHLLFAARADVPVSVEQIVATVIADVVQRRLL